MFELVGCTFHGFVNVCETWFPGPVTVHGCHFLAGTNLLGNVGRPYATFLEGGLDLSDTSGKLDLTGG